MSKDHSRNYAQKESGGQTSSRSGLDLWPLATLGLIVAVLAISFSNWRAIDRIQSSLDSRLGQIDSRLEQVVGKMGTAAAQLQPPRRGPDPNRVYAINTAGAPAEGPADAPITIAEFSDFQ